MTTSFPDIFWYDPSPSEEERVLLPFPHPPKDIDFDTEDARWFEPLGPATTHVHPPELVKEWQRRLNKWAMYVGRPSLQVTGFYGALTVSLTEMFQRAHSLPVTGVADEATDYALLEFLGQ